MQHRWEPHTTPLVAGLRDKLDEPSMTVRKAGAIVGVSGQTVANWAKGTVAVTLNAETQHGLARLLGVSPRKVLEMAGFDLDAKALGRYRGSLTIAV